MNGHPSQNFENLLLIQQLSSQSFLMIAKNCLTSHLIYHFYIFRIIKKTFLNYYSENKTKIIEFCSFYLIPPKTFKSQPCLLNSCLEALTKCSGHLSYNLTDDLRVSFGPSIRVNIKALVIGDLEQVGIHKRLLQNVPFWRSNIVWSGTFIRTFRGALKTNIAIYYLVMCTFSLCACIVFVVRLRS